MPARVEHLLVAKGAPAYFGQVKTPYHWHVDYRYRRNKGNKDRQKTKDKRLCRAVQIQHFYPTTRHDISAYEVWKTVAPYHDAIGRAMTAGVIIASPERDFVPSKY